MFTENVKVATRALTANKLRSVLTTLGIIIGVTSVIALLSIGNGVQQFITRQFEGQGSNLVFILPARIEQVLTCPNSNCISRSEPVFSSFAVKQREDDIHLQCKYCEKSFARHVVLGHW